MSRRVMLYDDAELLYRHNLHLTPGPVQKDGPARVEHTACDLMPESCFAGAVVPMPGGGWRLYYSGSLPGDERVYRLGLAQSDDGIHWTKPPLGQLQHEGAQTNWIWPEGMPEGGSITQPQVVLLPDGRWLMWFWWHGHDVGRMPYVVAESADGLSWKVIDLDMPHIMHPADRELGQNAWVAGLTAAAAEDRFASRRTMDFSQAKRLRSNDATYVYYDEALGKLVMYSVWLLPTDDTSGRYTPHDNAPGVLRTIHRRESSDGIAWSDPEMLIVPDEHDPLHQEFYYLAVQPDNGWYVGFLGHYRCWEQTMDLELCFSRDSHLWARPLRGGWVPRGEVDEIDHMSAYATNRLIDLGEQWLLLYQGGNAKHNGRLPEGVPEARQAMMAARMPKGRFAGLRATERTVGSLCLRPFNHGAPCLTVDAEVRGRLQAELRDPFGRPLPGYELNNCRAIAGDSSRHVLTWTAGKSSEAYRYDTVGLRLEIEDGVIYSIET